MKSFLRRIPDIGIRRPHASVEQLDDLVASRRALNGQSGMENGRGPLGRQINGPLSLAALAIGAFAVSALAVGAAFVGQFVVGKLLVRRSHIGRLDIDTLTVGRLEVKEPEKSSETPH
jgi:hypothetical protein